MWYLRLTAMLCFLVTLGCTKISPYLSFEQTDFPSTTPTTNTSSGSRVFAGGVGDGLQTSASLGVSGRFSARSEGAHEFTSSGGYRLRIGSASYQ